MKYKAIIFDMDGTIIDSEAIWNKATNHIIELCGATYTQELADELHSKIAGLALKESCRIIKEIITTDHPVEYLVKEKIRKADELYQENIMFIQGFEQFHQQASGTHKLKTGIATNATDSTVFITNQRLNLTQFFGPHIYKLSDVNFKHKPNPDLYLHAAEKLAVDPRHSIAIEDSAHGIQAAKSAGMLCIGINTSKKPEMLKQADLIIDSYDQLDLTKLLYE